MTEFKQTRIDWDIHPSSLSSSRHGTEPSKPPKTPGSVRQVVLSREGAGVGMLAVSEQRRRSRGQSREAHRCLGRPGCQVSECPPSLQRLIPIEPESRRISRGTYRAARLCRQHTTSDHRPGTVVAGQRLIRSPHPVDEAEDSPVTPEFAAPRRSGEGPW